MTDPSGPPDEIDLRFVADDWAATRWPVFLRPFGFSHRFEVIQAAFYGGVDQPWIDRPVWLRLADYMALEGRHHRLLVVPDLVKADLVKADLVRAGLADQGLAAVMAALLPGAAARTVAAIERHGVALEAFLAADTPQPEGEWRAPAALFVLDERSVRLAMTAGHSAHDSATYAFHARRDVSGAVVAFLQLAPGAAAWNFDLLVSLGEHG